MSAPPSTASRRRFLQGTVCFLGAPLFARASALGRGGARAPSERVAVGCIGIGRRGTKDMLGLMRYGAEIVAVCDVDRANREAALRRAKLPPARGCGDFRELLGRRDVDAVLVATPDHWHVPIGIAALKARKDLYLEKPLGISIEEGKAIRRVVRQTKRVFMHGTEQRGMPEVRHVAELVRNGRLGKVHAVTVACPGGREIPAQPEMPVPDGFDWDMWLGPAPRVPYTEKRRRPPYFFFIRDYAPSGFICGWGVHHLDFAQWALGLDETGPVEVEGTGTFPKPGSLSDTALTWRITYRYASGVKLLFTDTSQNPEGVRFEGTEGSIFKAYRKPAVAEPASLLSSRIAPGEVHLYRTDADDHSFVQSVRSRRPTCSPIGPAHRSTTLGYLGDIAIRLGRKLGWDPERERFRGDEAADAMLTRPHRAPWTV